MSTVLVFVPVSYQSEMLMVVKLQCRGRSQHWQLSADGKSCNMQVSSDHLKSETSVDDGSEAELKPGIVQGLVQA